MNHLSLFSGIGGFDLAAECMGWKNIAHCEWNPFCRRVLKYYWPNAISYEDITKTDFYVHRGNIDILTGGFPCQPYSLAGLRKGKDDERHLWPHMLRAIREVKPRWVVGENVFGIVGWNGGLVFEEVQADLEAEGYEVQPYILPAAAINAPHRRDRVWFVAYSNECSNGRTSRQNEGTCSKEWLQERNQVWKSSEPSDVFRTITNSTGSTKRPSRESREPKSNRSENNHKQSSRRTKTKFNNGCGDILRDASYSNSRRQSSEKHGKEKPGFASKEGVSGNWENFPTQSPICDGNDVISSRLVGITFPKWRNESIKGGGNAIVPQVALQIFKAIEEYEKSQTSQFNQAT